MWHSPDPTAGKRGFSPSPGPQQGLVTAPPVPVRPHRPFPRPDLTLQEIIFPIQVVGRKIHFWKNKTKFPEAATPSLVFQFSTSLCSLIPTYTNAKILCVPGEKNPLKARYVCIKRGGLEDPSLKFSPLQRTGNLSVSTPARKETRTAARHPDCPQSCSWSSTDRQTPSAHTSLRPGTALEISSAPSPWREALGGSQVSLELRFPHPHPQAGLRSCTINIGCSSHPRAVNWLTEQRAPGAPAPGPFGLRNYRELQGGR